jgi:hypothetical protein
VVQIINRLKQEIMRTFSEEEVKELLRQAAYESYRLGYTERKAGIDRPMTNLKVRTSGLAEKVFNNRLK